MLCTAQCHSTTRRRRTAVSSRRFALFDLVTLTFDLFHLILIGGRATVIDYACVQFGDFSFSRFGFVVRTDRQTDRITEADAYATTIGVSNIIITLFDFAYHFHTCYGQSVYQI